MKGEKSLLNSTSSIAFLVVVFLNAFSDLGHKIIIQNIVFKIYDGEMQIVLTAIVNALILLPFILVFSPAGFLADRFSKSRIMQNAALLAVVITLGITYAYYWGQFVMAFAFTFLLALQSAIYGPAKYGYIKELYGQERISGANAAVQAVTTVAILGGIIVYTLLFEGLYDAGDSSAEAIVQRIAPLGWLLVLGSVVEYLLALRLPNRSVTSSSRSFKLKRYLQGAYLFKNLKTIRRKHEIFDAIIALGIFWSISQVVLAIFGEYAKSQLGITNTIFVQGVMALAGIGIVAGSVVAAKFSHYYINMGFALLGSIGITLVVILIPWMESLFVLAILFLFFGLFSGFIMVVLNAKIQLLAPNIHLGTILAGSNFIQTLFMFFFLCLTTLFAYLGATSTPLFYAMALLGFYLISLTYKHYSVDGFWAFMQLCSSFGHHYHYHGLHNIPNEGAVLLLANHISWADWLILQLPLKRRINYMMDKEIYHWRFFHKFFVKGEAIPLSPRAAKDAFKIAHRRLSSGEMVAIFPEGKISNDGEIGDFYRGYEIMPKDYDGVLVCAYIAGMEGSLVARYRPKRRINLFKRREVHVYFSEPFSLETTHDEAQKIVINMKENHEKR